MKLDELERLALRDLSCNSTLATPVLPETILKMLAVVKAAQELYNSGLTRCCIPSVGCPNCKLVDAIDALEEGD